MGRQKLFSRDGVLEKALPVFWEHGFADTSLHDLETATGVNKSGLYAEFDSKEDLYIASLRFYLARRGGKELLSTQPYGWANVEQFLRLCEGGPGQCKGCFSVNSMRELAVLPAQVHEIISESRKAVRVLLLKNIEAEKPCMSPNAIAELISVFFSGICIEQNLPSTVDSTNRKIANFMSVIRGI
jgi:AcrR family transcriptional regulator